MSSTPLISVCIVTYNHQDYIADCLSSVLAQYGNFCLEIVLGDDTSTDNTVGIVQEIISTYKGDAIIHLFAHEKNLGPSQNYQFLIAQTRGDFIAHLDGDDFWLPGKLQKQLQFLLSNPDCPACYSNALVIKDDKSHWGVFNLVQPNIITLKELIATNNFLNHSSLLYNSRFKKLILEFPEDFIDYRIHLHLAHHGNIGFINQILVAYRINSSSSMLRLMREKFILLYIDSLLSMANNVPTNLLRQGIYNFLQEIFFDLWRQGKIEFIKILLRRCQPIYKISLSKAIITLLPTSFWLTIDRTIYRRIYERHLRILQHQKKVI